MNGVPDRGFTRTKIAQRPPHSKGKQKRIKFSL
jgi:hypothetical protein